MHNKDLNYCFKNEWWYVTKNWYFASAPTGGMKALSPQVLVAQFSETNFPENMHKYILQYGSLCKICFTRIQQITPFVNGSTSNEWDF